MLFAQLADGIEVGFRDAGHPEHKGDITFGGELGVIEGNGLVGEFDRHIRLRSFECDFEVSLHDEARAEGPGEVPGIGADLGSTDSGDDFEVRVRAECS